jgi:hypothetical protein
MTATFSTSTCALPFLGWVGKTHHMKKNPFKKISLAFSRGEAKPIPVYPIGCTLN